MENSDKPYYLPLTVLLWILIIFLILDFIVSMFIGFVVLQSGIFDKVFVLLGF